MKTSRTLLTALVLALLTFRAGAISASPIQKQTDARPVPLFIGQEATPNPITSRPIPQNPHMSSGSWSAPHDDTYMSDTYMLDTPAPLGKTPMTVVSAALGNQTISGVGGVTTFDSARRMVVGVIRQNLTTGEAWAELTLMDPLTLTTLATLPLPSEIIPLGARPAGMYSYQDDNDRIVIGTPNRTVWVVAHTCSGTPQTCQFTPVDNNPDPNDPDRYAYNLNVKPGTNIGIPANDNIQALQPDFAGHLWFTSDNGVVGTLDMQTGQMLGSISLTGERIVNGSAADEDGGVYVVTTRAMYRFDADTQGKPVITWQKAYDAGTHVKAGQVDIGSGTNTATLKP